MAYTTINKSTDYFNTLLWTGDNASSRTLTGVGFQPDWVWQKCRSHTVPHLIYDAVRTAGNDKELCSNDTTAQGGQSAETDGYMSAFTSDGFTVSAGSSGTPSYVNASGRTFASWNWKANGQGSSNTDGSVNTTYTSVNTTAGFSIVKYAGTGSAQSMGHGLGSAPKVIIVKTLTGSSNTAWIFYTTAIDGSLDTLALQTTQAKADSSTTPPTSSVFYVPASSANTNTNGRDYIAYCFAEKTGYSKFGSYTGNGNADGTFVYTGFKPAWVLVKNSQQGGDHWYIWDNKRPGYNQIQKYLGPSRNNAEADSSSYAIDMVSNGFKIRSSTGAINNNGETIVYIAFAEAPLVGNNNVPCTAR